MRAFVSCSQRSFSIGHFRVLCFALFFWRSIPTRARQPQLWPRIFKACVRACVRRGSVCMHVCVCVGRGVRHTGPTLAKCAPFKSWFSRDESGKFLKFGHGFERASSSGTRYACARAIHNNRFTSCRPTRTSTAGEIGGGGVNMRRKLD